MNKGIRVGQAAARTSRFVITVILSVLACRAFNANALTETNLYSFGGLPDGYQTRAGLAQGSDTNFYGTTFRGGAADHGTVFRISPSGMYTSLYSFGISTNDGSGPSDELVRGSDGNLYGTTHDGGMMNSGTVFRISPGGSYSNFYSFGSHTNDGASPTAGLIQGSDGNFYGATEKGGTAGVGMVFRISASGSETNLYSFGSYTNDGQDPLAGLVQGSDSNLYGTTLFGGTTNVGTVFRISPSGVYTSLYSFGSHTNDGFLPFTGLVQGSDGNFYGTTYDGGTTYNGGTNSVCPDGCGAVFRISPSGVYTTLYSFGISTNDGTKPTATPVQGSDGNIYGMTIEGGTVNSGTIFRISLSGSYSNLYSFGSYTNDGTSPAGLMQGSDGNFYGTTVEGGTTNFGTIFKLIFPVTSPGYQITAISKAGTNIIVAIPAIAGEIYQLQFSSSMAPTNWVNIPGALVTNSSGGLLTLTNFGGAAGPQGFYRFAITP
jgi:uncharacterized repeat protein (TIGR03803 family)